MAHPVIAEKGRQGTDLFRMRHLAQGNVARRPGDRIRVHGARHHLGFGEPRCNAERENPILDGRQPIELTAARMMRIRDLPLSWAEQRQRLGFSD